jgi:hypothetical protein
MRLPQLMQSLCVSSAQDAGDRKGIHIGLKAK